MLAPRGAFGKMERMTHILLTRYGGLGDLVMILPTIEKLHQIHPHAQITFRTYRDYGWFLRDHPLIDLVVLDDNRFHLGYERTGSYEVKEADVLGFGPGDLVHNINFHGVIERSPLHGVLAFAEEAGINLGQDWVPVLPAECWDREPERYRTVVQLRPNQDGRGLGPEDFPPGFFQRPGVYPISQQVEPRQFVNLVANAKCFIGPDSAGLHLAAAAGVPEIIGLYNERFPPEIRAYPGVEGFVDRKAFRDRLARYPKYP